MEDRVNTDTVIASGGHPQLHSHETVYCCSCQLYYKGRRESDLNVRHKALIVLFLYPQSKSSF